MALRIYNASAGSGKTFTLVNEFLRLSLGTEPFSRKYYQSILAITFTKKAAGEMKERIVAALAALKNGEMKGQGESLMAKTNLKQDELVFRAASVLEDILFNYGKLNISTIDSFFQRLLRSFAQELSLSPKLEIELDSSVVALNTVNQLLAKVNSEGFEDTTQQLLGLLYTEINKPNGAYRIERPLNDMTNELFKDSYRDSKSRGIPLNPELITDIQEAYQTTFELKVDDLAKLLQSFDEAFVRYGLTTEDFKIGGTNSYVWIINVAKSQFVSKSFSQLPFKSTITKGIAKGNYGNGLPASFGESYIQPIIDWYDENAVVLQTWEILMKNWEITKLSTTLENELSTYRRDSGIFPLADATLFLKEITLGDDASFVYEKIGTFIKHIFIDEFQDTSRLQWQNLAPLVKNCLANDWDCLIVGDVKQSIYRWRGGDLNLLRKEVSNEMTPYYSVEHFTLADNFRSSRTVIEFNNLIYGQNGLSDFLQAKCADNVGIVTNLLVDAYKDAAQNKKSANEGFVQIELYDIVPKAKTDEDIVESLGQSAAEPTEQSEEDLQKKEDIEMLNYVQERLPLLIDELLALGYRLKDIGILVKINEESNVISRILTAPTYADKYKIITEKSLLLQDSLSVKVLLACLKLVYNTNDTISATLLIHLLIEIQGADSSLAQAYSEAVNEPLLFKNSFVLLKILPTQFSSRFDSLSLKPIFELVEYLIDLFGLYSIVGEQQYLQVFKDKALGYTQKNGSDLGGFLEWWAANSTDIALSVPESEDAIRILTIHKSKGLEYPIVIMPFVSWPVEPRWNHKPELWVQAPEELHLPPVLFKSKANNSWLQTGLATIYAAEVEMEYLDALNALYVGTTRAEKLLFIFTKDIKLKKGGDFPSLKNIGQALNQFLTTKMSQENIGFSQEVGTYSMGNVKLWSKGQMAFYENKKPHVGNANLYPLKMDNAKALWREKLTIRPKSAAFFKNDLYKIAINQSANELSSKAFGVLIHDILSSIQDETALGYAISLKCTEAQATDDTQVLIHSRISKIFENDIVRSWFRPGLSVIAEKDILMPTGLVLRPDRVVIADKHITLIDFKTGSPNNKHSIQINNYAQVLNSLYPNYTIDAYIAYIHDNPYIEQVAITEQVADVAAHDDAFDKLL